MPEEEEESQRNGEEGGELSVGRGHAIAFPIHFCSRYQSIRIAHALDAVVCWEFIRFGRSSLMMRFNRKFKASQPICPVNMRRISTSREDHMRVV